MNKTLTKQNWLEIGREYGRTKGAKELGDELKVSKQRIYQIVQVLRKKGVDIPNIRNRGMIDEVVKILKAEKK